MNNKMQSFKDIMANEKIRLTFTFHLEDRFEVRLDVSEALAAHCIYWTRREMLVRVSPGAGSPVWTSWLTG